MNLSVKEWWEKVLGMKFSEPEIRPDGTKRYLPGDTVTISYTPETDIKWDSDKND